MQETDFRYVKIDETENWNKDFIKDLGPGAKIVATYIFDATERTHLCEATPSYFLRYAGTEIQPGRELSDSENEHYDEVVREAEFKCNDNDHYRHCRDVKDSHPVPTKDAETLDEVLEDFFANPW
jgi:hypothetical protein